MEAQLRTRVGTDLSPYLPLLEAAKTDGLPVERIPMSPFEIITNGNVYVRWAIAQIQRGTPHTENALKGLSVLLQHYQL